MGCVEKKKKRNFTREINMQGCTEEKGSIKHERNECVRTWREERSNLT